MIAQLINNLADSLNDMQSKLTACWTAITKKGISVPANTTRNITNLPTYIGKLKNPAGTINITQNGVHNVSNYASAQVDVQGEVELALDTWLHNQTQDINHTMQIEVSQEYIDMYEDVYVGCNAVYIERLYIPDSLLTHNRDTTTDVVSTNFIGFQDSPNLRYVGQIIDEAFPDACRIPPGVTYCWFRNTPQENDYEKPLFWGGIHNWGFIFPQLDEQEYADTYTGIVCINLSFLNLTPNSFYTIFANLVNMTDIGCESIFEVVVSEEQWNTIDSDRAMNILAAKGWNLSVI
ncbi:MAG: hypothetical protein NC038_05435 [Paludibacter sp.]|nr:hypothetical protein [Bacteroidales bacterium]MCM1069813.1 hypothetical protein [Prevotella sp.]MCM1353993.1 hypothetical protein [Bacteroides sp.]MCM1443365.1 hypothetical protein [Muribaculum sp.]MCM1482068.1 hypothetical protein [Paludibacter sp.]